MNIRDFATVIVGGIGLFFFVSGLLSVPMTIVGILNWEAFVEPTVLALTEEHSQLYAEYRTLRHTAYFAGTSVAVTFLLIGLTLVLSRRRIATRWLAPSDTTAESSATSLDIARLLIGTLGLALLLNGLTDLLSKVITSRTIAWNDASEEELWSVLLQFVIGASLVLRPSFVARLLIRQGKNDAA